MTAVLFHATLALQHVPGSGDMLGRWRTRPRDASAPSAQRYADHIGAQASLPRIALACLPGRPVVAVQVVGLVRAASPDRRVPRPLVEEVMAGTRRVVGCGTSRRCHMATSPQLTQQEAEEFASKLNRVVTSPQFMDLIGELAALPEDQRKERAAQLASVDTLRNRGVPIPEGLRLSTRFFESP